MKMVKLVNFQIDEKLHAQLKILAAREGSTIKEILTSQIESYCKIHKAGNPQHLITSSMENDNFIGFPSMAIDYKKKGEYIENYLQKDQRLNKMGNELWGHVVQWYTELKKY